MVQRFAANAFATHARSLGAGLTSLFSLDVRSLAAFRIALGLLFVADAVLRCRDFRLMFAADGMFPPDLVRGYFGDVPTQWSLLLLTEDLRWAGAMLAVEGLAGACLVAGWRTTLAAIVAWVAQLSIYRRTIPVANAGDLWLSCLVFWSCFLPLGAAWSLDARGRPPGARRVCGPATAALMLQVMAVYLNAGLAKWNGSWLTGEAIRHALSVHDHGTTLGAWITGVDWLIHPLSWGVLAFEIVAPILFVLCPSLRAAIAAAFILFHLVIWMTMSVGLFAPIGIAAWLPLLPGTVWDGAARETDPPAAAGRSAAARWLCAACGLLAATSFVHASSSWSRRPLPAAVGHAINATGLSQQWGMFGAVPPVEQWVYARAEVVDGRVVDPLRGGRPVEEDRPAGGFTSLPHHRWHKLLWILPRPQVRPFAPSVAAALAADWNARHVPEERIVSLEIRFARQLVAGRDAPREEMLVGSWPDRDPRGAGNLDRLLESDRATGGHR